MLQGETLTWWNIYSMSLEDSVLDKLDWETFKKKVLEEYCNERSIDRIIDELRGLKKGNLSVKEYNKLFIDKFGLVGHLVPTEKEKIKAYIKGLSTEMMNMVRVSKASTLREVIEEARLVEDSYGSSKVERNGAVEKRRWEGSYVPSKRPRQFNKCQSKHFGPCNSGSETCFKCGKSGHIYGDFPFRGKICFGCKESGHVKSECPKLKTGSSGGNKMDPLRVTGRAFQMTTEEAKASMDVVSGTFLQNFVPTRILFDYGTSFSFVSSSFGQKLSIPTSSLEDTLMVELVDGDQVVVWDILRGCEVKIEGKKFPVDLIPMIIGGFDVVIGIEWLENNHAKILCVKKLIQIPISDDEMVTVYGERWKGEVAIISMVKARKCLSKGSSSFLVYVIDAKLKKKRLEDVKVVKEFPDVFPDDLLGLPPDRQVEFKIDLAPGVAPIARSPYHLVLEHIFVGFKIIKIED
ncbi:hypothetical protein L6452_08829 [Arctium lappa]|uniref:Uncharacterized protein n=1 Tax=Arctium lappa TaxID=4217 RepID=A0ACB9DJD6_ARCLA|nr:hypothetical protein L6452_08829 [Arctium lappa]